MKKAFFISSICFIISISLSIMHVMKPVLLIIKYLTLVFAFAYLGYACFQTRIKKETAILYWLGVIILLGYTILTMDTFLFHAIKFVPGIIRYPLYSLYGLPYIVFMLPGFLLCFQKKAG